MEYMDARRSGELGHQPSHSDPVSFNMVSGSYNYSTLCFVCSSRTCQDDYLAFFFLCRYVKPVFNWFGIDGKYLQLLMSRDNDFFWRETRLSEEQKVYNVMSLCSTVSSIIYRLASSQSDVHL